LGQEGDGLPGDDFPAKRIVQMWRRECGQQAPFAGCAAGVRRHWERGILMAKRNDFKLWLDMFLTYFCTPNSKLIP